MSWKKNAFSYLIWLIYTLVTGTVLVFLIGGVTGEIMTGVLGTAVLLLFAGALVLLLHRFAPKYSYDCNEKHVVRGVVEAAIAVVLLAVGLVLRIEGLDKAGQIGAYFEMAQVVPAQGVPQLAHGAVYFYVQLLHFVFYFLGNKFIAGIGLQILLQYGAAILLYIAIRRLTGHITALVALTFVMLSPYMIQGTLILSPEMLYFLLFALTLMCLAAGQQSEFQSFRFLIVGLMAAVMTYLDVAGLLLLFLALSVFFGNREENTENNRKLRNVAFCILAFLIGFIVCVFVDSYISGKSIRGVLTAWFALYRPAEFSLPVVYTPAGAIWECIPLFGMMALGIFSFWRDRKRDYSGIYAAGVCSVILASCVGVFTEEMQGNLWLFLLFAILAGTGAEMCIRKLPDAVVEKKQMDKRESVMQEEKDSISEQKRGYIENPLPLPKKHEKRVMDYVVNEKKDEDDFDIDIVDGDDFDI